MSKGQNGNKEAKKPKKVPLISLKSGTTTIAPDPGFVAALGSAGVTPTVLPPGELTVFIDAPNALHIDKRSNGYGLGIPIGHGYVPTEIQMGGGPDYRTAKQARQEKEADDRNATTIAETTCVKTIDGV